MPNKIFDVVIEIPAGSRNKYEIDHKSGEIRLDRMLFTSTRYPYDYGFVKNSLSLDGDPLDALVMLDEPTFPGCVVSCRAIGMYHMQDEAANFPDPNDRATQESEFSLELRTRDRERKLIKKIDESLQNVDRGDYGFCETCGIEIGLRRLEARPTATQCIDCKTLEELREKQVAK